MSDTIHLIRSVAARAEGLPAELVHAIVLTESGGVATRWRFEPGYRYLWDCANQAPFRALTLDDIASERAPRDFSAIRASSVHTEWIGQQCSWGLMQVMGAVARERGYRGDFPELCQPLRGLQIGCAHLAWVRDAYHQRYGWPGVVAAYNAGSPRRDPGGAWVNQRYVDTVAANGAAEIFQTTAEK